MSISPPVIRRVAVGCFEVMFWSQGEGILLDSVNSPAALQILFPRTEPASPPAAVPPQLKEYLAGHLGDVLTVRLLEVRGPGQLLLEIAGTEVVAQGSAPVGANGLFEVRLDSLEPLISFSLADQAESGLPLHWQRLLREAVVSPNLFSREMMLLRELLTDDAAPLSPLLRHALQSLSEPFSVASLIAGLRSGTGLPLARMGLFYEAAMTQLWSADAGKFLRSAGREPQTVKEMLWQMLSGLDDEIIRDGLSGDSGKAEKTRANLSASLHSMLDMVELNQCLNNSGLHGDDGFMLLLPLWGWGGAADLWVRLSRDGASRSAGSKLYTLMIYLDLEGLGPLGAQVVAAEQELQVKLLVVGETPAQHLRELLPEVRKELRSHFPGGVRLEVEAVASDVVEIFRQRAFLASLPSLFQALG
ncbi:MAG: hypothetical protein JXR80_08100 [Deltaproteobacteria bacterium]|nr:hypothetical protein [Deltaproteobacteria bacterium]